MRQETLEKRSTSREIKLRISCELRESYRKSVFSVRNKICPRTLWNCPAWQEVLQDLTHDLTFVRNYSKIVQTKNNQNKNLKASPFKIRAICAAFPYLSKNTVKTLFNGPTSTFWGFTLWLILMKIVQKQKVGNWKWTIDSSPQGETRQNINIQKSFGVTV